MKFKKIKKEYYSLVNGIYGTLEQLINDKGGSVDVFETEFFDKVSNSEMRVDRVYVQEIGGIRFLVIDITNKYTAEKLEGVLLSEFTIEDAIRLTASVSGAESWIDFAEKMYSSLYKEQEKKFIKKLEKTGELIVPETYKVYVPYGGDVLTVTSVFLGEEDGKVCFYGTDESIAEQNREGVIVGINELILVEQLNLYESFFKLKKY